MFDEELRHMLAQESAAADQLAASMAGLAKPLGMLRKALTDEGFSTYGAEEICREYFCDLMADD